MNFHSGFSLKNDSHFFKEYRDDSVFCVSGFSYGAIKAFKYVQEQVNNGKRVDRLQLFSPAFFQTKENKFKEVQEQLFVKNKGKYLSQFLAGCFAPLNEQKVEQISTKREELHDLLYFEWELDALRELEAKGVVIEVYLGGKDRIIDVITAQKFFLQTCTLTYIKKANHFLQIQ